MGTAFNSSICLTFFVAGSIASRNELKRCIRSPNEALLELGIGEPLEAAFAARRSGVAGVVSASFTLSSVQPFPITTQSLIGSPQACERALDVLHRIRAGVTLVGEGDPKAGGPSAGRHGMAALVSVCCRYTFARPLIVGGDEPGGTGEMASHHRRPKNHGRAAFVGHVARSPIAPPLSDMRHLQI